MFRKPIKIKSNTPVKSSERKNIKDKIQKQFPTLTEEDLNKLLPKKEGLNSIKVVTAANEIVQIYSVQKRPICFEVHGQIFPSLYFLWDFPNLIHNFTTHKDVMTYLNSGADLLLPGVLTPPAHTGLPKFGNGIQRENVVAVNLSTNSASIAVGTAAMSSSEMEYSGGRGKCVNVLHLYGDKLCTLDGQACLPIPNMGSPDWLKLKSYQEDFPCLGDNPTRVKKEVQSSSNDPEDPKNDEELEVNTVSNEHAIDEELHEENENNIVCTEGTMTTEEVDELLNFCFFTAIKYSKTLTLPILTSNFYKLQMLAACPPSKTLDIKKSSFKKLKPFLDKMCKEKIITIKEMKKGVESIVNIDKNHPKFEEFYLKPEDRPAARDQDNLGGGDVTNIIESYIITQSVLPIFNAGETKYSKGDTVSGTAIRQQIRQYVNDKKCQHENPKLIQLDDLLQGICKSTNAVTWEEMYEKVCESMKNCYKVKSGQEEKINKGKVSPIVMSIANRSGNKKVTLVDNLELFGIRINEFAKECQHGVAASTSISLPPGKKVEQLLVQGNQILFVYNLLVDKYKIPKRYIKGLENAPKKKK